MEARRVTQRHDAVILFLAPMKAQWTEFFSQLHMVGEGGKICEFFAKSDGQVSPPFDVFVEKWKAFRDIWAAVRQSNFLVLLSTG